MDAPIVIQFDAMVVLLVLWIWLGAGVVAFGLVAALLAIGAVFRGRRDVPPR